jgi:hypothetical protein
MRQLERHNENVETQTENQLKLRNRHLNLKSINHQE